MRQGVHNVHSDGFVYGYRKVTREPDEDGSEFRCGFCGQICEAQFAHMTPSGEVWCDSCVDNFQPFTNPGRDRVYPTSSDLRLMFKHKEV